MSGTASAAPRITHFDNTHQLDVFCWAKHPGYNLQLGGMQLSANYRCLLLHARAHDLRVCWPGIQNSRQLSAATAADIAAMAAAVLDARRLVMLAHTGGFGNT
jgi:hypothetical protein